MVLEYGDIDLARLLAKHEKACREGGSQELDENFIRLYWQQMLQASFPGMYGLMPVCTGFVKHRTSAFSCPQWNFESVLE